MPPQTSEKKLLEISTIKQSMITLLTLAVAILCAALLFYFLAGRPPADFPVDSTITINPGSNVSTIVEQFKSAGYVRSANLLYLVLIFAHDARDIKAGTYYFTDPVSVRSVADIITEIGPKDELLRLTIPEGTRVTLIAAIAKEALTDFDAKSFIEQALPFEGKLFPETYFVPEDFTADELLNLMNETYETEIAPLRPQIERSNFTESEILTLASIIEREANSDESMKLVSGVFQNRLAINMPLQADASIEYVLDKPLSELTPKDLEIDSPYNTYLTADLPPTPIGNPGLEAIKAVLEPTASDYFFYLTANDGTFYFAKTFDEHRVNIARYLR